MSLLDKNGYVFLKGVVKGDIINYTNSQINNYLKEEHIFTKVRNREDMKHDKYYVNNNYSILNSFNKIQYYRVPVFNVGGNKDTITNKGLIEVYNPERIMTFINSSIDVNLLKVLVNKLTGINWRMSRMNLKFSNNVTAPEKIHQDDQETCLKCCIYLTDVNDYSSGPNMFVEGSHIDKDAIHDKNNLKVFNGKKGDVLISYQNGFHGRAPNPGRITAYLVINFVPVNGRYTKFIDYMNRGSGNRSS
jgi:hypothetical protein